jgi:hypothetical protein
VAILPDEYRRKLMKLLARKSLMTLLATAGLALSLPAQTGEAKMPSPGAKITKFFIDEAQPDSGYNTGPLHIVYSDGTEVVQKLPPLKKSTETETVFNAVGFSGVQLADDGRTLGWTVDVENCCTSYPIPLEVAVFRAGKVLHSFHERVAWKWMFLPGSKQIAIVWGATHGPEVGDYQLYDIASGRLRAEVFGDEDIQRLKPDAPEWAKALENWELKTQAVPR